MARKSKEEAAKTRVKILASALSLFAKKGYENTTFNDIAARLKMTKGAVYWHFDSKEALLKALVDLAFDKFQRQIEEVMPSGELTFPAVAEMMVKNAVNLVEDPKSAAFFRLMKCQIKWADETMTQVREDLLSGVFGPKQAFLKAINNDIANGKVCEDVNAQEIVAACLALWDGLVQAKLDKFLNCDLKLTLEHSFQAIWNLIRKGEGRVESGELSFGCDFNAKDAMVAADLFATARRNTACGETTSAAGNSTKRASDIEGEWEESRGEEVVTEEVKFNKKGE